MPPPPPPRLSSMVILAAIGPDDDFGRIAFLARLLVLPFPGLELAFDIDLGAFPQIFLGDLGGAAEDDDAVPLGPFLHLAGVAVLPAFGGRHGKIGDLVAVLHRADFGIAPQIADEYDLVDAACHDVPHSFETRLFLNRVARSGKRL